MAAMGISRALSPSTTTPLRVLKRWTSLYGNEGILPARWQMRYTGKALLEQLQDSPTLLWLGPSLGLDTQQGMELLCLVGALLAFSAMVMEGLRDSLVFLLLDNLLLEMGFLAILVAPLSLFRSKSSSKHHDSITFWLVRWLLFRLMFASGVVKLTSRCPTCVVGTFVIEIAVPFLFFAPIRCLRLGAFYLQMFLQVLIILTGNYNFFNLLTIILCFSLLDDDSAVVSWAALLVELGVYVLIIYFTKLYFSVDINWKSKSVSSKTAFTFHQFNHFLKTVTIPTIWLGVLSLTWEVVTAMFKCACVRGFFWKLWATVQWAIFTTAAVGVFALSVVPYTYIDYESNSNVWPVVRKAYETLDRYQLVNSYGLFRRMTGVGGRPEVVIEGSMDKETWTEIEFMYKPGNVSGPPPVVAPHQPRLDWQMWFAALGPHTHSPWFSSLVHRLLQGKRDDPSKYPFSQQPPAFIRARLYKYWFTESSEDGVVREHVRTLTGPLVIWSLFCTGAAICLLKTLFLGSPGSSRPKPAPAEPRSKRAKDPPAPAPEKTERKEENRPSDGGKENSEDRALDSDRSPRKRK
ncbi:hypothetical protein JZ751_028873 [Albula glossodonta]|uniref:Lipase maturation factor n=1 Tax=Albula glossodonta TaxID=121402 RepID=A0A8T2NAF3_9TELE|nr:hypothetical protein JZ751_028873 [Albula glossodonta]